MFINNYFIYFIKNFNFLILIIVRLILKTFREFFKLYLIKNIDECIIFYL